MIVRTRFSPSPTGNLHIGGARTTLFSALYAAKYDGQFILRIEDTDMTRSTEAFAQSQQEDLHWLGVNWQEGPGVDGPYGPYWQSQRHAIYQKYYDILEKTKLVYPCFCSDQELLLTRKIQLSRGQAPRYAGTCRKLSEDEVAARMAQGKKPAWRFIVAPGVKIEFTDAVKGQQQFLSDDIGDFIIRRADGTAPFLFCNAIDDAMMKISHVIRGEDHLANTPRQILLLQTLNLPIPHYAHLALILGDDGTKLSKRHGSFSLKEMQQQGYLPIAIINYLTRLGHACDTQDLLPFDKLAKHFYLEKISRSAARFDASQLMYWQKMAVQSLDNAAFLHWLGEQMLQQVPLAQQALFAETIRTNIEFPHDAIEWAKIFFHENVPIDEAGCEVIRSAGEQFFVEAEQAVDNYGIQLPQILNDMKTTLGVSGKKLFMPLRVALTGKIHGPELVHIAELLGQKKMKHRLSEAFKLVKS